MRPVRYIIAWILARYERQTGWLLRRLTPGQYLGLHLTVGLLTAISCLWLFGALAESVITKDSIVRLDQAVATILRYLATPDVTTFFLVVTALGSGEVLWCWV